MLSARSYLIREAGSIPRTTREYAELDDTLRDMEICEEDDYDDEDANMMMQMGFKSQEQLRTLYRLIVKRDELKIRIPFHWEKDLIFTEILNKDNFGNYGNTNYEIVLPYEIFMLENVHYKGIVRFKTILNLPNVIRDSSLTNKNRFRKSTQLITGAITDYVGWLINISFNTHEEKRANLKLFRSDYLIVTKAEAGVSKMSSKCDDKEPLLSKSDRHLVYHIELMNCTLCLSVFVKQQQFHLIRFNLKRNFQSVQKFQNQLDIEFTLKLTMFIEMARKEMMQHL